MKKIWIVGMLVMGCGGSNAQESTPGCDYDGEACMLYGYASGEGSDGTCRPVPGAGTVCCAGCWDAARAFCQDGTTAPLCGVMGEDCSAARCE